MSFNESSETFGTHRVGSRYSIWSKRFDNLHFSDSCCSSHSLRL